MARQYGQVVGVVSKPPDQRSPEDAQGIVGWFRKKSRLFDELASDIVCDIVRNCQFETKTKDDVLIRQGDYGDCFYVLLRGRVSIYILTSLTDDDDMEAMRQHLREADQPTDDDPTAPRRHLDRSKFGNFIVQLEEGQSFGELALISKECIRNASIIVDEPSDLLVVDRKLYNRSLKTAQMADFEQRNQFVSTCPLFRWWQPRYKRQMAYSIVKETVSFQEYIYKQGQPVDKIYFILNGQGRVVVNPERHWHQYTQLLLERAETDPKDDDGPGSSSRRQARRPLRRPTTAPPGGGRKRRHQRKDVELCLIGVNEVLGAAEFVLGLKTYYESVQTTEACEMYSLDLKHYDRLIVRRHLGTLDVLKNTVRARLQNRIQRMAAERCALFRLLLHKLRTEPKVQTKHSVITRKKTEPTGLFTSKSAESQRNHRNKPLHRAGLRAAGGKTAESDDVIQETTKTSQEEEEEEGEQEDSSEVGTLQDVRYETASSGEEEGPEVPPERRKSSVATRGRPRRPDRNIPLTASSSGEFHDWETSDLALSDLETRIKHWISGVSGSAGSAGSQGSAGMRSGRPRAVAMRRVTIDTGVKIRPGAKVIVSRRADRPHTASPRAREGRTGTERTGTERTGTERTGTEQTGTEQTEGGTEGTGRPSRQTGGAASPLHVTFASGLAADLKGSPRPEQNHELNSDSNLQVSSLPKRKKSHQYSLDEYNALKEQLPINLRPRRNSRRPDEL